MEGGDEAGDQWEKATMLGKEMANMHMSRAVVV